MLKKEFNSIIFNKKLVFKIKNENICKNIKINYFIKKNTYSSFKKIRHKELFFIMMKFESYFGFVPFVKRINIRIKNKKKKVFSLNFIYMSLIISNKFNLFFDLFFVKNSFFLLFENLSKNKHFDYSQEFDFKNLCKKYLLGHNVLSFNFNFGSIFLNENILEFFENYKRKNTKFSFKFVFFGLNSKYILNFLRVLIINYSKFILYYYKYFRNKTIKI